MPVVSPLLVGAVVAVLAGSAAEASSPALRMLDRDPLVVRGDGFVHGERVTVTALTGLGPRTVHATARNGTFRVTVRVPDQPCAAAFAVRARGSDGSAATMRLPEPPPCVPPPRD
jgi:hypothetical protein